MDKKKNETRVVAWFIPSKAVIKFEESEDSVKVADNVMEVSNFDKYPILKGDTVEVGMQNDEVTFLRKVKGVSKKKKEEKEESSSNEVEEVITKEVYCVSQYGLKFVGDSSWTNFSEELLKKDVKSMGVVAKNTITVGLKSGKIIEIKKFEEKEEKKSEQSDRKASYRDEESTDKRTASMNAKDVVVALINSSREEVNTKEKIELAINALTKKFYEVTKNL